MAPRQGIHLALLVVSLLATLGHVCALPGDAHAIQPDEDRHEANVFHGASCDALRPANASIARARLLVDATVAIISQRPWVANRGDIIGGGGQTPPASPPLYLRHTALLI